MPSYLGVPFPANNDGAVVPADMQLMVEALGPRQVFSVSGATERDNLYGDFLPAPSWSPTPRRGMCG